MPQLCDTRPFLVVRVEQATSETFPAQLVQKAERFLRIVLWLLYAGDYGVPAAERTLQSTEATSHCCPCN